MPTTNEHTIIAAFSNASDAEAAASDLTAAGLPQDSVYLESANSSSSSRASSHEGGIKGWFKSVFGSDDDTESTTYESAYQQGRSLLRVDVTEDQIATAEAILNRHSPIDIHEENEGVGTVNPGKVTTGATQSIPVVEEDLQVGKRQVLRGGVRVYSRVSSQPVEENINLREERIRVDRQAVNRPATEADFAAARNQSIDVQEFAEEAVVAKQARVVEEVRVGKDVSERTQTVRENLRRTDVTVDRQPSSGTAPV